MENNENLENYILKTKTQIRKRKNTLNTLNHKSKPKKIRLDNRYQTRQDSRVDD